LLPRPFVVWCKLFYSLRSLMRFSIRDLFWLTVVVALAIVIVGLIGGWSADRFRLESKIESRWRPPEAGSQRAMDLFLRERAAPYNHAAFTRKAAELCFVPGTSLHQTLVVSADKSYPTKDLRFPRGVEYEYWCNGEADESVKIGLPISVRAEGHYCVHVIVAGSPPVIQDLTIVTYDY
jgi:hypothetical protein